MNAKRYAAVGFWIVCLIVLGIIARGCIQNPNLENDQPISDIEGKPESLDPNSESWDSTPESLDSTPESWGSTPEEVIEQFVNGYGVEVVSPRMSTFSDEIERMRDLIVTLDDRLTRGDDTTEALLNARSAWSTATMTWQKLVFVMVDEEYSFEDLYHYPHRNRCRLDRMIVPEERDIEGIIALYSTLDVIEYFLFGGSSFSCPPHVEHLNEDREAWSILSSEEIFRRRISLARLVANDLYTRVVELRDTWSLRGEDWALEAFSDRDYAFRRIAESARLLDSFVLYQKLKRPLYECRDPECLDKLELRLSKMGLQAIQKNLEGFRVLFYGDQSPGLDDILIVSDASELVERMNTELAEAEAAARDIPESMERSLLNGDSKVEKLHDEIADVVELLVREISTVMGVSLIGNTGHMD